jgi:hypothetical protein
MHNPWPPPGYESTIPPEVESWIAGMPLGQALNHFFILNARLVLTIESLTENEMQEYFLLKKRMLLL